LSLLRSYLEANALLSAADLEVAVRHQQGQGGSLDTALLELGLLTAAELDLHLSKACGLPTVPARLLETGPARPWQLVPKALVDIGWAMPLAIEDGNVMVAVHPDLPDARLGQLYRQIRGFMPMVAPECCLAKLAAERSGGIVAPRHAMLVLDVLDALQARDAPGHPQDTLTGVVVPPIQLRSQTRPGPAPTPSLAPWIAPPAPRDLYVDSGATAVLPVDAADSISATVVGPVPPPDAADSLSATIIGRTPDPGDSLGPTAIRRPGDDPGSSGTFPVAASGTFPVAASGTFPAADSGAFPAASSGVFPDLRSVGAQAPRGARPAAAAGTSTSGGPHPAAGRAGAPVPKDSSATTGTRTADDDRSAPVPADSRSAPVPTDIRSAPGPTNASVAGRPDPATTSRATTDGGARGTAPLYAAAPAVVTRRVAVPADSPYIHGPSDSQDDAAPQDPGASLVAPILHNPMRAELLAQRLAPARLVLGQARERDRITAALVQGAIQIAPRVALFGVKREGLRALAAPGSALQLPTNVVIPIAEGSLLDRAVLGQIRLKLLTEPRLADAIGRPLGLPCLFEPVYAQDRCVLMLYLDRDGGLFDTADHDAARDLCELARGSLEALLRMMSGGATRSAGLVLDSSVARVQPGGPNPAQPEATNLPGDGHSTARPGPGDSQANARPGPGDSQANARPGPGDSQYNARPGPGDSQLTLDLARDSLPLTASPAPRTAWRSPDLARGTACPSRPRPPPRTAWRSPDLARGTACRPLDLARGTACPSRPRPPPRTACPSPPHRAPTTACPPRRPTARTACPSPPPLAPTTACPPRRRLCPEATGAAGPRRLNLAARTTNRSRPPAPATTHRSSPAANLASRTACPSRDPSATTPSSSRANPSRMARRPRSRLLPRPPGPRTARPAPTALIRSNQAPRSSRRMATPVPRPWVRQRASASRSPATATRREPMPAPHHPALAPAASPRPRPRRSGPASTRTTSPPARCRPRQRPRSRRASVRCGAAVR
jgi:hypothetical protein